MPLRPGRRVHGGGAELPGLALAAGRGRLHQGGGLRGTAGTAATPAARPGGGQLGRVSGEVLLWELLLRFRNRMNLLNTVEYSISYILAS